MMKFAFMQDVLAAAKSIGRWPEQLGCFEIDTRALQPGDVFLALPGTRVDGHDFLAAARAAGAAGAIVSRPVDDPLPQLVVTDVEGALQALAAAWRQCWKGRLLALTGSNGKTTTKEMLAAIIAPHASVCITSGNLNNHLGVPLSLLRLRDKHAFAVIEMGANHPGEIAQLCGWAKPDVGLITLAASAHLEGFGSLAGVARSKGEIYSALGTKGMAVINAADKFSPLWRALATPRTVLDFATEDAAVRAQDLHLDAESSRFTLCIGAACHPVQLAAPGSHNVQNALAAAAGATALGFKPEQIARGLAQFRPVSGRLRRIELGADRVLWDDSYNANPSSVGAAIKVLAGQKPPRLLCLGDMAELGADAKKLHAQVGEQALNAGIDALWSCGELARNASAAFAQSGRHFSDASALGQALLTEGENFRSILIKGSRSARMDIAVTALQTEQAHA